MSYRLTAACIISTAQQANPNVNGHSEPALAQPINDKTRDESHSNFIIYLLKHLLTCFVKPIGRATP